MKRKNKIKGKDLEAIYIDEEMTCSQYFHNIFTTNSKWQVVTDCYCYGKKVILILSSNLN